MDPDERKLVEAARRGDPHAFRELVRSHQRRAYAVAIGMVHDPDDARDICQDAFVRVHKALPSFEGEAKFYTWLYRIVMNLCIDLLRRRRGRAVEFDEAIPAREAVDDSGISPRRMGFDPGRALVDKELRAQLRSALDRLSPDHRAVLLLREVDGLSYQEIADSLECPIGTVMSRLFHARKKMQSMLLAYRSAAEPAA